MSDHKRPIRQAAAAKIDLQAIMLAYHASALRGDGVRAEELRREAHDMLDQALDRYDEAARTPGAF